MGQSFATYKRILLLELVQEIFDSEPFEDYFEFDEPGDYADIEVPPFRDPKGNLIRVFFNHTENGVFEVEFSVNNTSFQDAKAGYGIKEYAQLLSTVGAAVSQFLEEYEPQAVTLVGTDIPAKIEKHAKTVGQKDRIYAYYISQIKDTGDYMVDKSGAHGISLVRKASKK